MADDLQAGSAFVEVLPAPVKDWVKRVSSAGGDKPIKQDVEPTVSPQALDKARKQVELAAAKVSEARNKEA
jgi:hypothetical protein